MKLRNFGRKCLREVEHYLKARGRQLAGTPMPTPIKSDFHRHAAVVAQLAKYPDSGLGTLKALRYCVIGIASEADTIPAPLMRGINEQLTNEDRKTLSAKLGNVLWYFFRCCAELGLDPEKVADENVERLRQSRSTLAAVNGDVIRAFFDAQYVADPKGRIKPKDLHDAYKNYMFQEHGVRFEDCASATDFGTLMRSGRYPVEVKKINGVKYYAGVRLNDIAAKKGRKSELQALAGELPAPAAAALTHTTKVAKAKQKLNPRVSTRSIAAELISIFEKGNEDDDQGEDGSGNSRDGEKMVRGTSQE